MTRKLLTLLYLSELYAVICPYSLLEKRREMSVEVYNAHTVRYNRPLQIKMAVWSTFFKFELVQTIYNSCLACFIVKNKMPDSHYYLQHAAALRSLSRIVYRGQEGPKGSKVTLRPNF